jgi:folate-dependent phosphoribosylglycinamide formyltransferase PurN
MNIPVRVGLVVIDDGLYTHRWAEPVMDTPGIRVIFACCLSPFSAPHFNPGNARGLVAVTRRRMRYYGLLATVKLVGNAVVERLCSHSVRSAARARGIELLRPTGDDINDEGFCAALSARQPELLVCAFSQRAAPRFLSLPSLGCLNVHFSMLPRHRGREPLFHAMLAGEGAGVSVHWMTSALDGGSVVAREFLDVTRYTTLHEAIVGASELAARLVPRAIHQAARWKGSREWAVEAFPLNAWPTREQRAAFRRRGFRFA